ncbi:Flp pilus assembly protein CpaB [Coralliovum pocilloporae]|uniref:Flp pilus assembly protein CpaB n=1 Tax=Coralliovum pocilloporae TaxID=3066369 RepID=UPI003307922E
MKIIRIAILFVALGAGLFAAMLAMDLTAQNERVAEKPVNENVSMVLTASKDIRIGARVAEGDLTWVSWPKESVQPTFVTQVATPDAHESFVGHIARTNFLQGEPIRSGRLIASAQGFLSAILPAGMRAIAVQISANTSAGGFILPNDRVDVILTSQQEQVDGTTGFSSNTILENVRVLAIDQQIEEKGGEKVVVGQTATLELDRPQSEIIAGAERQGDIILVLRSLADNGTETPSITTDSRESPTINVVKFGVQRQVAPK